MATKAIDNPGVRFIAGRRYGGANQRFLSSSDDERLSIRAKKFTDKSRDQHKPDKANTGVKARTVVDEIEKKEAAMSFDVRDIQWEERKGSQYVTVNCPQLVLTLKKKASNPLPDPVSSDLYKKLLEGLDPKFGVFVRFHVIAMGTYPGMKETFMKLKWREVLSGQEKEFVLPKSFLQDCKIAIANQHF